MIIKPNILFICPTLIYGGGEVYLKTIINGAINSNAFCEVHLVTPGNRIEIEVFGNVIKHKGYDTSRIIDLIRLIVTTNRIIKHNSIDYVFINGFNEFGWCAPFIRSKNIVCTGHNNFDTFKKKIISKSLNHTIINIIKRPFQYLFVRFAFKKFKKFICINKLVYKNLSSVLTDTSNIIVIPNGIDELTLTSNKKNNREICFGRIGRLEAIKGNIFLIDAFYWYTLQKNDGQLVFAGDGPELEILKAKVRDLSLETRVNFLGFVKKEDFYSKVDVVISSSSYEASPLVILESMACKLPVISTDVGGVSEIIENKKTGILVEYGNIKEMKNAMLFFSNNDDAREKISEKAYIKYEKKFTSTDMVNKTLTAVLNND